MARKSQRGDRAARQAKVRELANVLRDAEPTPFALQGACTHGLRSELCLRSWPYDVAHAEADKLVKAALDLVGAKRPPVYMAQPEYALREYRFTEYSRCARCRGELPEGRSKFCSDLCGQAHKMDRQRFMRGEELHAAEQARRAAWRAKQDDRPCEYCGRSFKPSYSEEQRFCSVRCSNASRVGGQPTSHPWRAGTCAA